MAVFSFADGSDPILFQALLQALAQTTSLRLMRILSSTFLVRAAQTRPSPQPGGILSHSGTIAVLQLRLKKKPPEAIILSGDGSS